MAAELPAETSSKSIYSPMIESSHVADNLLAELIDSSWHLIRTNQIVRERHEAEAELARADASNLMAEANLRAREEQLLLRADLDAVRLMEDDTMVRLILQEQQHPPDAIDAAAAIAARSWANGPASQGWVLERIVDAVLADDPGITAALLADLRCEDSVKRVGTASSSLATAER